ncbi:uncharacterized protein Z518_06096 [Rhinocladiella mackenziei CBS 650.93]|uniref:Transcription factor domain-containing protein n=1 Tax=Rhinocladiella mackenziei CBS 650.93 TaxID=1442369 RepID=A0A0D2IHF8_9EURO|nr:uncharacterized protein Z518_06096 [Rhinocladiella mackenziei CBS 650.93]KIX05224.1 hypothetical protein Z518_06096 [Rhinocladiella mackenziei CBS 650.93]
MSLSQHHNLFPVDNGNDVLERLLRGASDLEKWEAWARVESTKRLCVCLLMGDAMFSHEYEVKPILRFDLLKYVVPGDLATFEAPLPAAWWKLLLKSRSGIVTLYALNLPQSIGNYEIHGLLAICWAQVSERQHRGLLDTNNPNYAQSVNPAWALAEDTHTRSTAGVLSELYDAYKDTFATLNPNCLVSWHNTCMNLAADPLILQDAAGRNGAVRAKTALELVAQWSETATARRACLHAAQTFRIMSQRKISEGMMFQSETALFDSALVLGLYLYLRPQPISGDVAGGEPFQKESELLDDVDWTHIGVLGLSHEQEEDRPLGGSIIAPTNCKSRSFVLRDGLPVSFEGVSCPGEFRSAQRIFLAFSTLLSHVAPWNARRYCPILRTLSACNF